MKPLYVLLAVLGTIAMIPFIVLWLVLTWLADRRAKTGREEPVR